jgi:stringent starvation protein B
MTSLKPYLIRAIYEWIVDNNLTPHLLADADDPDTVLPQAFVEDGKIVLNIRPEAVHGLSLGNETIQFNARFGGKPMQIVVPIQAVLAIYAKENGKGMIFDHDENDGAPPPEKKPPQGKPKLRVVK